MKPLHMLNPKIHGRESTMIAIRFPTTAFVLEQFVKSITNAIRFSNTAMIVEHAAKNMQRKKIVPQILPALIALKMFGSVIKIRLGPLSGWTLNAKQAGKIINPAINATNVSRTVTQTASPVRVLSFPI